MEDDFDVLTGRVENLDHALVAHETEERREVEAGRERIHQRRMVRRSHLDQAQFRPECRLTDELRVDRDKIGFGEGGYGLFKGLGRRDELHVFLLDKAMLLVAEKCVKPVRGPAQIVFLHTHRIKQGERQALSAMQT